MGRGQAPAPPLQLTILQREILEDLKRKHSTGQQLAKRIQIVLLANQGHSNSHIKRALGISLNTVKTWRRRWASEYEGLLKYEYYVQEDQASLLDFRNRVVSLLEDLPRSGTPKTITLAQEQQIIALACDKPEQHGVPISQWTHELLAYTAIHKGIVDSISARQVGRILKNKPSPTA